MIPKFRAWYHKHEAMYSVASIDLALECITVLEDDYVFDFEEVALMQSTRLEDKNGVEIYLDDVLSDEYGRKYIAVFKGDCVRCDAIRPGGKNRWISNYLEVIGNIHENPELLEVRE